MFTTPMIKLVAIVLERDREKVAEALLAEGVMQFITISELEKTVLESFNKTAPQLSLETISETRRAIEDLLHTAGIYPDAPKEINLHNRKIVRVEEVKKRVDSIHREREQIRERQRVVQQELLRLEDIKKQIALYGLDFSAEALISSHYFIVMYIGKLPSKNLPALIDEMKNIPSVNLPLSTSEDFTNVLSIYLKRDSERVEKILGSHGWVKIEPPAELLKLKTEIFENLSSKISSYTEEQNKLKAAAQNLVIKESGLLKETWTNLRVTELFNRVQSYFKHSTRVMLFSGWLPASTKEHLSQKIHGASEGRCYLEWYEAKNSDAEKEKIPVQIRNPRLFAPFQMLVSNFGIPEYGSIDPTVFIMPVYLSMFGLMFADAGHGAVLLLLGLLGMMFFKKKRGKETLVNLSCLIAWCGGSAILFGALFGSYFGMRWFKPIWFNFHGIVSGHGGGHPFINNIFDILLITITFGIAVIIIGLVFNWINLIRKRKWIDLLFDKKGITGAWIYGAGIYLAFSFLKFKFMPQLAVLFALIGIPIILLFIKEPLHFFMHRKEGKGGKFTFFKLINFIMEWIVELLEVFSGYLSNTLSFMRVAGLGIAHVSLMIAFFSIARMVGGKGFLPVVILIAGNILVICLEGLSAGIQSLRLSYYEFFTKFFKATGKSYSPVSLDSKD